MGRPQPLATRPSATSSLSIRPAPVVGRAVQRPPDHIKSAVLDEPDPGSDVMTPCSQVDALSGTRVGLAISGRLVIFSTPRPRAWAVLVWMVIRVLRLSPRLVGFLLTGSHILVVD